MSNGVLCASDLLDIVQRIDNQQNFRNVSVIAVCIYCKSGNNSSVVIAPVGDRGRALGGISTINLTGQIHDHACGLVLAVAVQEGILKAVCDRLCEHDSDVLVNPHRSEREIELHEILRDEEVSRILRGGDVHCGDLTGEFLSDGRGNSSPRSELCCHLDAVNYKSCCTCGVLDVQCAQKRVTLCHVRDHAINDGHRHCIGQVCDCLLGADLCGRNE